MQHVPEQPWAEGSCGQSCRRNPLVLRSTPGVGRDPGSSCPGLQGLTVGGLLAHHQQPAFSKRKRPFGERLCVLSSTSWFNVYKKCNAPSAKPEKAAEACCG